MLIRNGYPSDTVWAMTPRELFGHVGFVTRQKSHEAADRLALGVSASRGDPKQVKKQIESLRRA